MKKRITSSAIQSLSFLLFFSLSVNMTQAQDQSAFTDNWPQWRGLYNSGATPVGNPPVEFSETKNVKWKTEIPGKGHATPIVWGNQIIIQTAVATEKKSGVSRSICSTGQPD